MNIEREEMYEQFIAHPDNIVFIKKETDIMVLIKWAFINGFSVAKVGAVLDLCIDLEKDETDLIIQCLTDPDAQ